METPLGTIGACVFDAYGTLFDVNAAAERCRDDLGPAAGPLAETWRAKQLSYTWLRSLMGEYANFERITEDALGYAMAVLKIDDSSLAQKLMALYRQLDAYPEVSGVLTRIRESGLSTAILSNGSPGMLNAAVEHAGLAAMLDRVLSVDELRIFKPHPSVYRLACERLGIAPEEICFLSSNAWDIAGAGSFGFRAVWVNRFGQMPERLPGEPTAEIGTLAELPSLLGL
jgi:2-haloacid dehalogenase